MTFLADLLPRECRECSSWVTSATRVVKAAVVMRLAGILVVVATASSVHADPVTIVDTFYGRIPLTGLELHTAMVAFPFVPSTDVRLQSVTVALAQTGDADTVVTMGLYRDQDGQPAYFPFDTFAFSGLEPCCTPGATIDRFVRHAHSAFSSELSTGQTYWFGFLSHSSTEITPPLWFDARGPGQIVGWPYAWAYPGEPFPLWQVDYDPGWNDGDAPPPAFRLTGTPIQPAPVPEPASLVLLGTGATLIARATRSRRRPERPCPPRWQPPKRGRSRNSAGSE